MIFMVMMQSKPKVGNLHRSPSCYVSLKRGEVEEQIVGNKSNVSKIFV